MQSSRVRISILLWAMLCAAGAFAQEDDDEGPEADDAVARMAARRALEEGETPPEALFRMLQVARQERLRAGRTVVLESALSAAVSNGVWINLGPTRADQQYNGVVYRAQDSGRVRSLVPHPSEP